MLTRRLKASNRQHGRAKRLRHLALAIGALGGTTAVLVLGLQIANPLAAATVERKVQRAVYVAYMDDPKDERGRLTYRRLAAALDAAKAQAATPISLEFVQIVVGTQPTIDEVMRGLVETRPAAIIATSDDVLQAAKAATESIPILFVSYRNPVVAGEVRSIAAPGVNRTGFTFYAPMLAKATELLIDGYPASKHIGVLVDSTTAREPGFLYELREARAGDTASIDFFVADDPRQLAAVLRDAEARGVDAWFVRTGAALWNDQKAVIDMMARTSKPVLYDRIRFVRHGGLMAYEARVVDPFRIWANQLLMIAGGTDIATIPVERPSQFDLALNVDVIRSSIVLRPSKALLLRANLLVATQSGASR